MSRVFMHFYVAAWLSILCVVFWATPSESADVSRPTTGPVKVYVTIFIIDVDGISSAEQNFDANVYVELRWKDPRLAHKGSKEVVRPLAEIWNPKIQVVNRQKIWLTFPEIVKISPDGEVFYQQRVWGSFSQPLKLNDFPFDRQVFSIQLVTIGSTPDEVELLPDKKRCGIAQELSIADWTVIGWKAEPRPYAPGPRFNTISGFAFAFDAQRESGYYVVKVILPLIFIVAMSWVVFWIDPLESGTQITVAITTMLTLIAYRFAIDAAVPKVSYLNRLDYFVLISTILVYASLIEVVVTSTFAKNGKISQARTLDLWMRWLFPSVFVLVAIKSFFF